ncbi:MAG TPA: Clp protease N-terminal domain-containing protein, partial [Terriglobia bacterium]|nr:Clp protease N-terminal domain-containing protein [Terriglobia bacterium]
MGPNLKSLIGKLNDSTRGALEGAAGLCLSRTHYDIEVEHFLMKLLDSPDGDFFYIAKQFGLDRSRLSGELARSLDKLKTGNARTPALSPTLVRMLTQAWTIGSIDYGAGQVRSGFTILALLTDEDLARLTREISREFQKIQAEPLRKDFLAIIEESSEEALAAATQAAGAGAAPGAPKAG